MKNKLDLNNNNKKQFKINWKKLGYNLLYPHIAIIICLLPISIAFLVLSLIYLEVQSIISIFSYLFAFYLLLVICFRIPRIIKFFKTFKQENKYMQEWCSNAHLRMNISLYFSLIWNISFAIFQLVLGFQHQSFWFYSMFAYYAMLAFIRFYLVKHTRKYRANELAEVELKKYITSGFLLLFLNLALSVIVFFIVHFNKTFTHHMITTIAIATYTFTTFTFAIITSIKYRKYKSPIYSAAKNISLIAASASILTLETTMLTTFSKNANILFNQLILSLTGIAVTSFTITMSIIMIVKGKKEIKKLNSTKND